MVRLWEHIDGLRGDQAVTTVGAKGGDVAGQCARITGDIADVARGERLQGLERLGMAAGTRWVDKGDIDALAAVVELAKDTFQGALKRGDVVLVIQGGIGAGIDDGAGLRFNGDYTRGVSGQEG